MSGQETLGSGCAKAIGAVFVALPLSMLWSAFATKTLWNWFVAEPFGVRAMTIPLALGLEVLVGMHRFFPNKAMRGEVEWAEVLGRAFAIPAGGLAFGYAAHRLLEAWP